ncbi:unnamed protein product [Rotaria sp. Silwood1]|nr:unnamed protein product [Rotaria sp. Silwood1]
MSSNVSLRIGAKRQRIMIIMADESIIDQIEKSNNVSLLKQIILPSEGNNSERSDKQIQLSYKKNKPKHGSLTCVVCGSSANGYNFGAITCESCKAFFRRNARKDPNEQKAAKRGRLEENRNLTLNSNSKTNNEQFQLSSSTSSDNVRIFYKKKHDFIYLLLYYSQLLTSIDTNILLTDFTNLLSSQPQQILLSWEDLQRIETISLFYQNPARNGLPWNPSMHARTFLQVINSYSVSAMRLLSFLKQIPEFNQLNVDDKVTLIKYNLPKILGINYALSYNIETNQLIESDSDVPLNTQFFPILHDYNTRTQIKKIFASFLHIIKYDRKIIELTVIILILTKGFSITSNHDEPILNDKMSAYRAQNYYTELLWKYMETRHGYEKAIKLFSELIVHVISWQTVHEEIENDIMRTLSPKDINELVPIMKSIMRFS